MEPSFNSSLGLETVSVPVCSYCESADVSAKAEVRWDTEVGDWLSSQEIPNVACHACCQISSPKWIDFPIPIWTVIQNLNDAFRRQSCLDGTAILSDRIRSKGDSFAHAVLVQVALFSDFSLECDPFLLHQFGEVCVQDEQIHFVVQCSDLTGAGASLDFANPATTIRSLHLCLSNEL